MHVDHLKRIIDPLNRRVRSMLMRASVTAVDDSTDLQQIQVSRLEGEVIEGCERVGQFGLSSVPPIGAEVIVGQIGGNADHQVVLGVDDKSRPHPLTPGSTVLYDADGTQISLAGDGTIEVTSSGAVTVNCGLLVINCGVVGQGAQLSSLHVTGNVVIGGTLNGHAP